MQQQQQLQRREHRGLLTLGSASGAPASGSPASSSASSAPASMAPAGGAAAAAPRPGKQWDERALLGCYLAVVLAGRLFLRSRCASGLPWALAAALEDGLSLLSFAVGLLYLHRSNGAPLALLAKRVAASPGGAAAAALGTVLEHHETDEARPRAAANAAPRRPVSLFYFAM
mmetsp:Transcript_37336/g.116020  ORF Transcript_37336/g.116020 Transcript_37336/m.116020 type:complete len:172 (-) Transcript_37336:85-600(-)